LVSINYYPINLNFIIMQSEGQLWILATGEHLPSDDCWCSCSHNTWTIRYNRQTFVGRGE